MRRALPLFAAAFTLAAGCAGEDPDDLFYYLGRVSDETGAAIAGASVTLESQPSRFFPSCPATDRTSLGLTQDGVQVQAPYQAMRNATANEDGLFYFDLMRFEIQPTQRNFKCFAVSAQGTDGAAARSAAYGLQKDLQFSDLAIWDGAALAVAPGTPARVPLPALPWTPSLDPFPVDSIGSMRRVFYDWTIVAPGGILVWHQLTESDPLLLEPELLEDFSGLSIRLESWIADSVQRSGLFGSIDSTEYRTVIRTPPIAASAPGTVPASRGATCRMAQEPLPGCPLTDGSLDLVLLPTWMAYVPGPGPDPRDPMDLPEDEIVLELARPVVPRVLVVRELHGNGAGAGMSFKIEGSADGSSWTSLAPEVVTYPLVETGGTDGFYGSGTYFRVDLDSEGQPVQQVRLTSTQFAAFLAAAEISVFE